MTDYICNHWRFVDEATTIRSSHKIYEMFCEYKRRNGFVGMDMPRKFLEMGHTRAKRYANHSSGRKYAKDGSVSPCEKDCLTNVKARSAKIFKEVKEWRVSE